MTLFGSKDMCDMLHFKDLLKSEFEMKDLGSAKRIASMELKRD